MRHLLLPLPAPLAPFAPDTNVAHRLRRVLRLQEGDTLRLCDGLGQAVQAVWQQGQLVPKPETALRLPAGPCAVTLAVGVIKGERMDWLVEKAAELGVDVLQPLLLQHCVVRLQGRDRTDKQARWQGLADAALEQCGRLHRMQVAVPQTLEQWLATPVHQVLWLADERPGAVPAAQAPLPSPGGGLAAVIGPEGGLAEAERAQLLVRGATPVALSANVLRAETAALAAAVIAAGRLTADLASNLSNPSTSLPNI